MARHNDVGKWGETVACEKLIREGYAIVARNWRMGHLEVDIIAARGSRIVFAEVKTRAELNSDPLEAVDKRKIAHLARAADVYIRSTNCRLEPQFDLFGISGTPDNYKMEHIADAFLPPLQSYNP